MTRGARGYTLFEVLVASSVLSITLVGLSALPITSIRANAGARRMTAAASLARGKIEELRATPYAALAAGVDAQPVSETASGGAGAIYTRQWTVGPGPTATTKEVAVTVLWTGAPSHQVTLRTLMAE